MKTKLWLSRRLSSYRISRIPGTFRLPWFFWTTSAVPVIALLTILAWAQPIAANSPESGYADMSLRDLMALEVFTAASLVPTELSKAPGTVYSFDREDFTRLGIRRMDDILQFVPGFQLNQYRKRHRSIWARGALDRYNDKFVLLVDGIQMRHLYYGHFSLGDNFPLEKVEKVEIILGPASSLYGANAFAGIISIKTRDFSDQPQVEATLEAADNARAKGTLLYNSPNIQAFASYLTQDAPFREGRQSFIGGETLQSLDEDYSDLFLKVSPMEGLTLMLDYQRNDTPFLFIPDTQDAFVEGRPLTLSALYESGDLERGRIEAKAYYTRDDAREYEIEQQTRRPAYREYQDATLAGVTLTGFKRLFDDHVFTLGASWQHERAENMDFVRHFRFDLGFIDPPLRGSLLSDPDIRNDDFALFVQDVWDIRPDLTLTLGARYDDYETFGDYTNYRAALVYAPDDRQVWKLLYGTAIRTPSLREYLKVLEDTGFVLEGVGFVLGGEKFVPPPLRPEKIKSLELGYLYQWEKANLNLTLFHNEIEDYIHETPTPDGEDEYFANSVAPWRMRGVEALLQYRLSQRLQLRIGGAWLDAEEKDIGDLPYLAEWSGSLNLNYNYSGSHHAGASLIYNSDRPDTNAFPDDDADSFVQVNINGFGEISRDLSYSVGIDNLFDKRVYDPAADFGTQHNTERSEREIWGRLEWRLGL